MSVHRCGRRQGARPRVVAPVRPLDGQTLHHRLDHRRDDPGLPIHQTLDDVRMDGGAVAGGQVEVLDAVLARPDPHQQIVAVADVPGDPQPAPVRLRRNRPQLRLAEPGMDLDDPGALVDGGARRRAGLLDGADVDGVGAAVVALHLLVRPVGDPAHARDHAGARDLAAIDAPLRGDESVRVAREVDRRGHPAHDELAGGDRHHVRVVRPMGAVPVLVVRVSEDVQMHVDVDQSRQDGHPGGVDDLRAVGHGERLPTAGSHDAIAVDEDDPAGQGRPLVPVDQQPADDGQGGAFRLRIPFAVERLGQDRRRADEGQDDRREDIRAPGAPCCNHARPPQFHRRNLAGGRLHDGSRHLVGGHSHDGSRNARYSPAYPRPLTARTMYCRPFAR